MAEKHNAREKGYEDYHLNIGPILAATRGNHIHSHSVFHRYVGHVSRSGTSRDLI